MWIALVLLYWLVAAAATYAMGDTGELLSFAGLPAFFVAHLLHKAQVPGMLEHGGLCGWGWCAPTWSGWVLAVTLIAAALWPLSALLSRAWRRGQR